jgi:hypothetical protein
MLLIPRLSILGSLELLEDYSVIYVNGGGN